MKATAKTSGIASTTIQNVLKKKESTALLSEMQRMGQSRKAKTADDIKKKQPKTTVSDLF